MFSYRQFNRFSKLTCLSEVVYLYQIAGHKHMLFMVVKILKPQNTYIKNREGALLRDDEDMSRYVWSTIMNF